MIKTSKDKKDIRDFQIAFLKFIEYRLEYEIKYNVTKCFDELENDLIKKIKGFIALYKESQYKELK